MVCKGLFFIFLGKFAPTYAFRNEKTRLFRRVFRVFWEYSCLPLEAIPPQGGNVRRTKGVASPLKEKVLSVSETDEVLLNYELFLTPHQSLNSLRFVSVTASPQGEAKGLFPKPCNQ
jgi:hypothetical protein